MPNPGNLLLALLLTEAIELPLAYLWGFRSRRDLMIIALVNLITNPALNFLLLLNGMFNWLPASWLLILALEGLVVLLEWKLLVYAYKGNSGRLFMVSLFLNFSSWLAGALLFK